MALVMIDEDVERKRWRPIGVLRTSEDGSCWESPVAPPRECEQTFMLGPYVGKMGFTCVSCLLVERG